jgi:hypothetical protein
MGERGSQRMHTDLGRDASWKYLLGTKRRCEKITLKQIM